MRPTRRSPGAGLRGGVARARCGGAAMAGRSIWARVAESATRVPVQGKGLVDFGSRMGTWRRKCLQNAVLALCRGRQWARVRGRLGRWTGNGEGAGFGGTARAARNLEAVAEALRVEGLAVEVIGVASKAAFVAGEVDGCWRMGAPQGTVLGEVVWSKGEGHVYVVRRGWCDSGTAPAGNKAGELEAGVAESSVCGGFGQGGAGAVDWAWPVVGAPKRGSAAAKKAAAAEKMRLMRAARGGQGSAVERGSRGAAGGAEEQGEAGEREGEDGKRSWKHAFANKHDHICTIYVPYMNHIRGWGVSSSGK